MRSLGRNQVSFRLGYYNKDLWTKRSVVSRWLSARDITIKELTSVGGLLHYPPYLDIWICMFVPECVSFGQGGSEAAGIELIFSCYWVDMKSILTCQLLRELLLSQ